MSDHTEPSAGPLPAFLGNGLSFLKRQHRDWKITVLRTSLDKLAYQMVFPYLSIYIVALGATGTQLGIVNSIGMIIAGFCGPFTGWLIDRIGPKKIYLIGIGFMAVSYLTYGLAQTGSITVVAMVGLLGGVLHQHPQLRDHLRQLPGQPGPGHGHADLRNGGRGPAGNGGADAGDLDGQPFRRRHRRRHPPLVLFRSPRHDRHLHHRPDAAFGPKVGAQRGQPSRPLEGDHPGPQGRPAL